MKEERALLRTLSNHGDEFDFTAIKNLIETMDPISLDFHPGPLYHIISASIGGCSFEEEKYRLELFKITLEKLGEKASNHLQFIDGGGQTLFHRAVSDGVFSIADYLLDWPETLASINHKNCDQLTAQHHLAVHYRFKNPKRELLYRQLINKMVSDESIDWNIPNCDGKTAQEIAKQNEGNPYLYTKLLQRILISAQQNRFKFFRSLPSPTLSELSHSSFPSYSV